MRNLEKMVNFRKFKVCSFLLLKVFVFNQVSIIMVIDRNEISDGKVSMNIFQYNHGLQVRIISHLCFHILLQYDLSPKSL